MPVAIESPEVSREYNLMVEAFQSFIQASQKLESAYGELQKQAQSLQMELEEKNRQLEINLAEKERVKSYLDNILQSLPCGVVVLGEDGKMRTTNPQAAALLGEPIETPDTLRDLIGGAGVPDEREISLHRPSGSRHLLVRSSPVATKAEGEGGVILILTDITRLKILEEENRRGERLRVMGAMSCQLAHEIRNPLGSIELFASMLEKQAPEGSEPRRYASCILSSARFLNNTLTNMLNFSKVLSPKFEAVQLQALVEQCTTFVAPLMEQRGVRLHTDFGEDGLLARADPELLKQALLNLILNAIQAMPRGGTLTLTTGLAPNTPDPRLLLSVGDTGRGIPSENLNRIFDPFFTTNRNGTGLGLSIVHTIVEKHGGAIGVESRTGEGTTFRLALPAVRRILTYEEHRTEGLRTGAGRAREFSACSVSSERHQTHNSEL